MACQAAGGGGGEGSGSGRLIGGEGSGSGKVVSIISMNPRAVEELRLKPNFFERKLKTFATARNYNTMLKLLSLSE